MNTIGMAVFSPSEGYWLGSREGGVFAFGGARLYGSMEGRQLAKPICAMASTSTGKGYWLAGVDGGVFTFGDAAFLGSMGGRPLNKPIVGMAASRSNQGYWLTAADGGVFTFGDAGFFGSMAGQTLNKPVVGMAATPRGQGYWLVGADGGVFTFGDAGLFGSMAGQPLNKPMVGIASTPSGQGYWMAAADGGVFTFGDAGFFGSMVGQPLARPVVGINATRSGQGYWLVADDGGIFTFGDAPFLGNDVIPAPEPWAILLCHPSDLSAAVRGEERYIKYFTGADCGSGSAYDYWQDMSYRRGTMRNSRVFAGIDLGHTVSEILAAPRQQYFNWGLAAAARDRIDLSKFKHKVVVVNIASEHGKVGGGVAFAIGDLQEFEPTFIFHEMGHEFGLDHSFGESATPCASGDARPGAYCDQLDIMSAMKVQAFPDTSVNNRLTGPSLNAFSREQLGWMLAGRVRDTGNVGRAETITLAAVNRPDVDGWLMLKFVAESRDPSQGAMCTYTVEFREATGWDRGLTGGSHVVLHEVWADGRIRLISNYHGGLLDAATHRQFVPPNSSLVLRLLEIDERAHQAKVRVWRLAMPGQRDMRITGIMYDPPGSDVRGEFVRLQNDTVADVQMLGWTLSDVAGHEYTFPAFTLRAGFDVRIWTGAGTDDASNLFWGRNQAVWNNQGDTATLRDSALRVIAAFKY